MPSGTLAAAGIRIPVVLVSDTLAHDGARAHVNVDAASERRVAHNVIAETPGGDGEHVVMAGGHLDSVRGGPGINDNGSGAATLIEAAEAIGPDPPGSRVRLAFWGAEELGLLGSRHYVSSLDRAERRQISAYINFDMVGSPNAVPEFYADGDAELGRVLRRAAGRPLGGVSVGGSSDHAPFMAAGVPVNGLYTGANERGPGGRPRDPCYHLACDTAARVNRPVLLRMARAAGGGAGAPVRSGEVEDQPEHRVQRQQLHALEPVRLAVLGDQVCDQHGEQQGAQLVAVEDERHRVVADDEREQHQDRAPRTSAIWALDPIAMFTARSILSLAATSTATQCSAALPDDGHHEHADEELGQADVLGRLADRADQYLRHHADGHRCKGQIDGGPPDRPVVGLLLVLAPRTG